MTKYCKVISITAYLIALCFLNMACSKDDEPAATDDEVNQETITPLSQNLLTNLTLENWKHNFIELPEVNPENLTRQEAYEILQETSIGGTAGGFMTPMAISVDGRNLFFLMGCASPLQVYLSATGGAVKISVIGSTDTGYDYIKYMYIDEVTPTSTRADHDFELSMDEKGAYTIILPPNKSNDFRVFSLRTESVGQYEEVPGHPYRDSRDYQLVQFPWSDDEALTKDPVIKKWSAGD